MKLVHSHGINDLGYTVFTRNTEGSGQTCPFYSKWRSMLERVYSEKLHNKYPTYNDTSICEEWLFASEFKRWMLQQPWEGNHLDKDILVLGNKLYSPATSRFVPSYVNRLLLTRGKARGELPLGVNLYDPDSSTPYRAQVSNPLTQRNIHLGLFKTKEAAHRVWQESKASQIELVMDIYKDDRSFLQDVQDALGGRVKWLRECSRNQTPINSL